MIFTSILLLMIVNESSFTQFKMLRGDANNYVIENVKREEDLEYPRGNREILNVLKQMWEKYYACLLERENEHQKPEIRRLLEGQYTELHCDICPRPFQDYEELEWKYKPLNAETDIKELDHLDLTSEMTYTPTKTLKIFNADESVAGLYVCFHKASVVSVYVLEVSKNDTIERVTSLRSPGNFSIKREESLFEVNYQWTQWTECNTCGRVGKKFKYGTCFISKVQNNSTPPSTRVDDKVTQRKRKSLQQELWSDIDLIRYEKSLQQNIVKKFKKNIKNNNSTLESITDQDWELEIIEKFSTGVPCTSQYLPQQGFEILRNFKAVKVFVKYCHVPCKGDEIFEVFDDSGKLIEWANNTAGIYSVFQKPPQLPPTTERSTIEADFGSDVVIKCPGTSFADIPITWKVNNKIIFPDVIANASNGRFTIDLVHRINLKRLRLKDSNIYSCWQRDKLVGTVHLNVEKKFKIGFDHHVTLFGIAVVVGTFLLVGSKILAREFKMRKK